MKYLPNSTQDRGLADLPAELVLLIARHVRCEVAINHLSQTNHFLHEVLTPYLYWRNSRRKRGRDALVWAAGYGRESTARLALAPYMTLTRTKPLLIAAKHGRLSMVKLLLSLEGVNIEARDKGGYTPLARAAVEEHKDVVRALVEAGADLNPNMSWPKKARYIEPPLLLAVGNNHLGVVRYLLDGAKVDIEARGIKDDTPLSLAARLGHAGMVRFLLETGADPNTIHVYQNTPLVLATRKSNLEVMRLLLAHGANTSVRHYQFQQDPVFIAVTRRLLDALQVLLESDAVDINYVCQHGCTALGHAARSRSQIFRPFLSRKDLDPDRGDTLYLAVWDKHDEMATALLLDGRVGRCSKHRALVAAVKRPEIDPSLLRALYEALPDLDVDEPDGYGMTLLMYACTQGSETSVRMLVDEWGADPDARSPTTTGPPLFRAVRGGYTGIVEILLQTKRVDANWVPPRPVNNALHMAAFANNVEMVRLLVAQGGVDPNVTDTEGKCTVSVALTSPASGPVFPMVGLLLGVHGIDVSIKDVDGRTPLDYARERGEEECIALIEQKLQVEQE